MRIARTTRDPFVVLSVYFNVGYLFDTLGDPARAGEILADEGLPLVAELGLPTVALSAHAGWYLWQAGRWDAGRQVVAAAARDGQVRSGRNLALAMTQALYEAVSVVEAGVGPEPTEVDDAVPWLIAAERAIWDDSPDVAAARCPRASRPPRTPSSAVTAAFVAGCSASRPVLRRISRWPRRDRVAPRPVRPRSEPPPPRSSVRGSCSARATRRTRTATTLR